MRIITWNLNGLPACVSSGSFDQFDHIPKADVYCFQEIRTAEQLIVFPDYHHFWYPAHESRYSGTLTLSRTEPLSVRYGISVPELDGEGRVITIDLGSVYVINTYVPNSQGSPDRKEYRLAWDEAYYDHLRTLAEAKPIIVCGDFNVTLSRQDVYASNERMDQVETGFVSDERSHLSQFLSDGFVDAYRALHPTEVEDSFTWWSNRLNKRRENKGWRLDYFFVSEHLKSLIKDVIPHHEITGSDHCPLELVLDNDHPDIIEAGRETQPESKNVSSPRGGNRSSTTSSEEVSDESLAARWYNRKKRFDSYREKLARKQSTLTVLTLSKKYDMARSLMYEILDDIRFKCLAVEHVVSSDLTPGVDKVRWKSPAEKMKAALDLDWRGYKASPTMIVEIRSRNTGKIRRAGILTYRDKAMSTLCRFVLSPIEEAHSDRCSYAFRPGRSRQDAITAIVSLFKGHDAPEYYVYADIKSFYANLQHKWILEHVPLPKDILNAFLKAGHIFAGELFPSGDSGISEGSPLSPIIANYTLDGLQRAVYTELHGCCSGDIDYRNGAAVRYADDVIIAVRSEKDEEKALKALKSFLSPRGLAISEEKSKNGCIRDGIDILGFSIKLEKIGMTVHPKEETVTKFISTTHEYIISSHASQRELIAGLNKRLMGWGAQYRYCDAYDAFRDVDAAVDTSLLELVMLNHPKTQMHRLTEKYWYHDDAGNRWFTLPEDRTLRVIHLSDTYMVSPIRTRTDLNPYFQKDIFAGMRQENDINRINSKYKPVFEKTGGRCLYCGRPLLADQDKRIVPLDHTRKSSLKNSAYIHETCALNDHQVYLTSESTDYISDYDVRCMLERIQDNGRNIRDFSVPADWKYIKLYDHFALQTAKTITLTFRDIEEILGTTLSDNIKSSNNQWLYKPGKLTFAQSWVRQGYALSRLELKKRRATFTRIRDDAEKLIIPACISEARLPLKAKREAEAFFSYLAKKYGLTAEPKLPRK